jgi:hypothetical protein
MPDTTMPDTAMPNTTVPNGALPALAGPRGRFSRPLAVVTAVVVLLLAGTVALWAHYGTAVFYETILAGIAACF